MSHKVFLHHSVERVVAFLFACRYKISGSVVASRRDLGDPLARQTANASQRLLGAQKSAQRLR
jgi:hypothetical protein